MAKKIFLLIAISLGLGCIANKIGLNVHQSIAISIFSVSILGTLFFWDFRLSFAFLGTATLLITRTIDLENVIKSASLEVILFLVGMMVLIGLLKGAGVFAWIVSLILRLPNLSARKFLVSISFISALLACAVDEVTSIIFVVAAILEICDYFEVDPTPFLIIAVLATNIGSSGTVLGNPIGILIAAKSGLTFEDFILKAFPVMLVCLLTLIFIVKFWYRKALSEFDRKIKELGSNEILIRLISVPPEKELKISLAIFGITLVFISLHHRLELMWNLQPNTILLITPLISSGLVMVWKRRKAREFIEKDVEWWTLLFFMLLFAQAGTLKYTGATDVLARHLVTLAKNSTSLLITTILWISTFGSSILDNVVMVAAFIPIVQSLQGLSVNLHPLWWALLFGGCLGGNITLVGSTANIVALGILEKEKNIRLTFFRWFRIGLVVGIITTTIVWMALLFLPVYY
ncbi:MAG: SLC13 family permease [Candidatus Omnitrophica bacterium]|nr:SLC13 family permease [Candidatus Omnitrophota bacterium]MCM8770982.1 SLC13 family permease [Candidatus Omnitrophota bacterium]